MQGHEKLLRPQKSLPVLFCAAALLLLLVACSKPSAEVEEVSYRKEIEKWRGERTAGLTSEEGWLTLVGLFWLKEGENKMGSDPSSDILLPQGKAPPSVGSLWLDKGSVRLDAREDAGITHEGKPVTKLTLQSDADSAPTKLSMGSLSFHVIKRGERFGLRVRDRENPARTQFAGLDTYPVAPAWRIEAKFEPYDPPKQIPIANVLGMVNNEPSPGAVVFEFGGQTFRLDPITEKGSPEFFLIFADETSGRETYGAGRYLYASPPGADGKIVLDFNKAFNPPCAFTKYATCPLPPRQNRLALRVEAGEKQYAGVEH